MPMGRIQHHLDTLWGDKMDIKEIYETMDYGTAPESADEANVWLNKNNRTFGHFIDGTFVPGKDHFETVNPSTCQTLARISHASFSDVDHAVSAANRALSEWSKSSGFVRAKILYALARNIQKHARLFSVLETLDNGKPIRESRDIDIPLVHRHFYYHAGMAQLMSKELPNHEPIGVCGQIIPWNFPLLMLAWKIAPALSMGNTVILKPAETTSLTALLFAEISLQSGVPKGVVNIVTGDGDVGDMIVRHKDVHKIAFTGSTDVGRKIRQTTAGSGKSLTLELGGKSPFIVFDDADLDSAVEGVVDAIWFNQGQVCCAGSRLLVQAGVAEKFHSKLVNRMNKLRIGDPLDKSIDMGAINSQAQLDRIKSMLLSCDPSKITTAETTMPDDGYYHPPTLIRDVETSDILMHQEIFGPVLVSTTFRTPSEAIALANNTIYGLAASVWSENINLALGLAPKLKAGVVWVNGTNFFDAAAGFGGTKESGFGREGGWEGLMAYTRPKRIPQEAKTYSAEATNVSRSIPIDRTYKNYVGGKQSRPDGGYTKQIRDPSSAATYDVPISNRKDVRNAVEAANKASGWSSSTGHLRSQILYYFAENLSARADEFATLIDTFQLRGMSGTDEVQATLETIFECAAWSDKFDGDVRNVPMRGLALSLNEPVGTIATFAPKEHALLGLVRMIAPTIAVGNRLIVFPSEVNPIIAGELIQVIETSDIPAGVVNILFAEHSDVVKHTAMHMDVDAVWCEETASIASMVEEYSATNLKRTWIQANAATGIREFLDHAIEKKTVWIPWGEG
jgi:aldehyde dehydrogenase (NAD+)